ncbi:MAG TPA: formyltransferase family protein [Patescibacteria group bacterium]|nr:formyltransferase family protein [Patescibacteria group bacterium]
MCGVIGISSTDNHASYFVRRGLAALQHRGQESAGISVINTSGKILTERKMGLVPQAISEEVLEKLGKNKLATGHTRYGTTGASTLDNAHPITLSQGKYTLSIIHNGNLPDISNLQDELKEYDKDLSDTILVARLLLKKRPTCKTWEDTLIQVLPECRGSYNFILLTDDNELFAIRDPFGLWSLSLGKLENGYVVASESAALDAINADFIRDVEPGEIIKLTPDGKINSFFFGESKHPMHSLFEYVYFARPDSFVNGVRIRAGREQSGRYLADRIKQKKLKPDVVVPVFESGFPAAKGTAEKLNIPIAVAITTSNYVGRTFIQPGQHNRMKAVNHKHNIVGDEIIGKKIVVVDDSAIRMTTSKALIQELRDAGAKEVYLGIASPPVVYQCDMGIDMRNKKDLPASEFEKSPFEIIERNIADMIGADEMIYLPIDETTKAFGADKDYFYWYPFGGSHPIRSKHAEFPKKDKQIGNKIKLCIFASGKGTYVQDIIDGINSNEIDAEIVSIVTNKKDAPVIQKAKKHKLQTKIIEYIGKQSDKKTRAAYEQKLLNYIKTINPDLILLSGWQLILGDTFLKATQNLHIPIINHHPALLTNKNEKTIATSRGPIPVLRGSHVGEDAFKQKLQVGGISVHQILPGDAVDVGPIIMKSEVRIHPTDTKASWEQKMHEAEHQLVSTALKRIVHVMKQNIDISAGRFPW